ncbi:hypothetical protein PAEPH01_0035 [Pancytospora epiphaga]|nr:hypothetical protein PAEPH01_0035 [Pancytospora epiphaga]
MFLFYISFVAALSQLLNRENSHKSVLFVVSERNTVHYIKTKNVRKENNDKAAGKTLISIFRDRMDDSQRLVYMDDKSADENTFFFTTPMNGKYYIAVSLEGEEQKDAYLDVQIYSGEANRPSIVSTSDVEVSKAEYRIRKLLEYVKNNVDFQNMDHEEYSEYRKVFRDIGVVAILAVSFKIVATVITLMYSNKKIKQFFNTQGVVSQK